MNRIDLDGRTAVVTGGIAGIGSAIAKRMAASGAHIALRDCDAGGSAAARGKLGGAGAVKADIANPDSVAAAVAQSPPTAWAAESSGMKRPSNVSM